MTSLTSVTVLFVATMTLCSRTGGCPDIVTRREWRAKAPKDPEPVPTTPVPYIVIHHTYIPGFCNNSGECKQSMINMQSAHQNNNGWSDIGYNFCIGGDGKVYEGRGWGIQGAHAPVYNSKSVGICFIGDFRTELPTKEMLDVAHELIECGIDEGHVDENYDLIGHRQITVEMERRWPRDKQEESSTTARTPCKACLTPFDKTGWSIP